VIIAVIIMNMSQVNKQLCLALAITVLILSSIFLFACAPEEEPPRQATEVTLIEESWLNSADVPKDFFYGYHNLTHKEFTAVVAAAKSQGIYLTLDDNILFAKDENKRIIALGEWQNASEKAAIPRPEHGRVQYTVLDGDYFLACYFEYAPDEYSVYVAALKSAGYYLDTVEFIDDDEGAFYAKNMQNYSVTATYSDKILIVVCEKIK